MIENILLRTLGVSNGVGFELKRTGHSALPLTMRNLDKLFNPITT